MDCIIIHYAEIGLKGSNRIMFERRLIKNIKEQTGLKVIREHGRLITEYNEKKIELLSKIPGIAYYAPAIKTKLSIDDFIIKAKKIVKKGPFRVTTKRSNKQFKTKSPVVNKEVGAALVEQGFKVSLKDYKTELIIEIGEKNAYLYTDKREGLGGLPVGVTGKLVALVSGGIDSPVACFEMIRRGCEVVIVHFYNKKTGVKEKILELVKKLSEYQGSVKVYLIPFLKIQQAVIMDVPAKYRMITYRRLMFQIGEEVLKKEKALGFITGDNVAQVASQTLENLRVIWGVTNENVYAPLLGMDKQEIIEKAKKIDTYKISIKPYSDCCSFLIAKHPETKADIKIINEVESKLELKDLVKEALSKAEMQKI